MIALNKEKIKEVGLRVETAHTFHEIEKHSDSWNRLALNSRQQHPAMTHAWISAYLKTCLQDGESWFCLFAFDSEELVGVLPLLAREYNILMSRYLMLRTPLDKHTMSVDILFKEEYGVRVIHTFTDYLNCIYPKVIRLQMGRISYKSETPGILSYINGISACSYTYRNASIIRIKGNYSDFRKKLSKKFIRNLRSSDNSLKKLGNIHFTVINDGRHSCENLEKFAIIENSGWKGRQGSSIKEMYWRFFNELIPELASKDWLEWHFLKAGEMDLAGYMIIPFGRTVYIFQTCFNEQFHTHSPGAVLTDKMLEYLFADGKYDEINFMGDPKWLLRWRVDLKPYHVLTISFSNPTSFLLTRIPYLLHSKFPYFRKMKKTISHLFN